MADNRDNLSSDVIKTSIFLQKFQLVIVGVGQIFGEISNDIFIFHKNFIIGAI